MTEQARDWHRLFGLMLTDFFSGSPFVVEMEKDLSIKQQLLDVVIVRRGRGKVSLRLPDGMEDLAEHNLITFKSHQEALDDWALKELTGHYVNYRKQASPSVDDLLPEGQFRLFGVCARYPRDLASVVDWRKAQEGVYLCRRGTDEIRVVVPGELPEAEQNAMLHLFTAKPALVEYGVRHYQQRSEETSTFLNRLFEGYRKEGLNMPYTIDDFRREYVKEHLKQLTPKERVEGLSHEDLLAALSPEQIAALLKRLKEEDTSTEKK